MAHLQSLFKGENGVVHVVPGILGNRLSMADYFCVSMLLLALTVSSMP